jgi:hypothetical protein
MERSDQRKRIKKRAKITTVKEKETKVQREEENKERQNE